MKDIQELREIPVQLFICPESGRHSKSVQSYGSSCRRTEAVANLSHDICIHIFQEEHKLCVSFHCHKQCWSFLNTFIYLYIYFPSLSQQFPLVYYCSTWTSHVILGARKETAGLKDWVFKYESKRSRRHGSCYFYAIFRSIHFIIFKQQNILHESIHFKDLDINHQ